MRQKEILIDPVAVDPDGLAEAQAVAGAQALTLNGALIVDGVFTGDYARQLGILSAGDDNAITFTVTGTDADGKAQSEAVAGSAGAPGTAETTKYYKTVTSVVSSGAAAGNVSVGTVDEFVTNTIPLNSYNTDGATVSVEAFTGTIDVSIQETFSRIQKSLTIEFQAGPAGLTNETAASSGVMTNHASGVRLVCNSYTSGADLRMVINQNRCN